MFFDLKKFRLSYQLSQVKLAHESGVSLPTIQNIEAGKANPTLEILEKLLRAFGLGFQISVPAFDGDRAAAFGVPLLAIRRTRDAVINKNTLKIEVRKWLRQILDQKLADREKDAVIAFLMGVRDHYPSYYQKEIATPLLDRMIQEHEREGRIIKLRRIALANMSRYL